eukprot:scaffold2860_cov106-Isochrysis_galbana.AAC.6
MSAVTAGNKSSFTTAWRGRGMDRRVGVIKGRLRREPFSRHTRRGRQRGVGGGAAGAGLGGREEGGAACRGAPPDSHSGARISSRRRQR